LKHGAHCNSTRQSKHHSGTYPTVRHLTLRNPIAVAYFRPEQYGDDHNQNIMINLTMNTMTNTNHLIRTLSVTLALGITAIAHAQPADWNYSLSLSPLYQGKGKLEGGGEASATSVIVRAGMFGDIGNGNRAGLTLNYDHTDYSFSNPVQFGGRAPWGTVERYGFSVPLSFGLKDDWTLGIAPSLDWIGEKGADSGESLTWGAIAFGAKRYANGNRLGFGIGAFDRLEKTSVFPMIIVDWKLSDRWKLVNPLPAGPTGPAGLELDYRFDGDWNLGLGAAVRTTRFRLSSTNVVANGIGEESGAPVFLRATRNLGRQSTLNLYAGIIANGKLSIENSSGNRLTRVDLGTTPIFAATLVTRF